MAVEQLGNSKRAGQEAGLHTAERFSRDRIEPHIYSGYVAVKMNSWVQRTLTLRLLVVLFFALTAGLTALFSPRAQATQLVWILPGAAETTGLFGARFSSTLFLSNLGNTGAAVQIGFIPYSGKPTPAPVIRSLAAGETQQISSVLQALFGLSSDAGTLTLSSATPLALWMTTVNVADTAGTYGLAIEPLASEMILSAGSSGNAIWASNTRGLTLWR